MAESSGMGEPTDTDQHASAVAMPELDELLCLESTICERLMATDGEGALTHAVPSATVLNHRTLFVKMIWRIREKRPAQFLDPLVFYLAVAYVDGVLWAECAPDKLKQSPAMPLACLLLAMKFQAPTFLAAEDMIHCIGNVTTRAAVLSAEGMVLNVLGWNLHLVTPAHFVCALRAYEAVADKLILLTVRLTSWPADPRLKLKPSLWAALFTNHAALLKHCNSEELALARTLFDNACKIA